MFAKLATSEDFEFYYLLKCDELNITWSGHKDAPDREKLKIWYLNNIKKEDRYFFLFFEDGSLKEILGYLYMDVVGNGDTIDTGHGVHSKFGGQGYGTKIIQFALDYAKNKLLFIDYFQGWIASDNIGSIKNVLKNGYYKTSETKNVVFGDGEDKIFEKYLFEIKR